MFIRDSDSEVEMIGDDGNVGIRYKNSEVQAQEFKRVT